MISSSTCLRVECRAPIHIAAHTCTNSDSCATGRALGAVDRYGLLKKKDGTLLQNPPEDHVLEQGDRVVALSRSGV